MKNIPIDFDNMMTAFTPKGTSSERTLAIESIMLCVVFQRLGVPVDGLLGIQPKEVALARILLKEETKYSDIDPGPDGNGKTRAALRDVEALINRMHNYFDEKQIGKRPSQEMSL